MSIQFKLDSPENYKRNWHYYNLAQTNEKRLFYHLLNELCEIIIEPVIKDGRPPARVKDLVFSLGLKLYCNSSGRRIISDLVHAEGMGYIKKAPHFNTLNDFLRCPETYTLLQKMLRISAMPLRYLEDDFSIDSSGFGTYQYERWVRIRFSKEYKAKRRAYLKGHICIGTRTNIVCDCEVTEGYEADVNQMPELLKRTASNFRISRVSADKAYSSKRMHQVIEALGATPYIPFKDNANPSKNSPKIWQEMYSYFSKNKEDFLKHYHKRSNVETVFSMIKLKFGEFLKSKTFVSQRNELVMKFICHNIYCLVHEIFENKIKIDFEKCLEKFVDRVDIDESNFVKHTEKRKQILTSHDMTALLRDFGKRE